MTSDFDPPSKGLRVAEHVKSGDGQIDAIRRATGIYESRGVGNSYLLTTVDGDVLVNAGTLGDARRGRELFKQVSSSPIRYIILTQSHANQYGGLEVYKTHDNTVIAHRNYPEDRRYSEVLNAHYRRGSRKFFGEITGSMKDIVPTREVPPDVLIDTRYVFDLGGRQFEVIWTPGGETRSSVIVWLANERIALVGNLFGPLFGNHPNLNTLRGDKPRSALEFIESAKVVRALKPELLLTGHETIRGVEHIEQQITRIIDAVQWVHDRTVDGMNEGIDVRTLMRTIKTPPGITLTEEYGKIAWNVRAIWHEYSGWFDPSRGTPELYGSPSSCIAPLIVKLVGNVEMLAEHAFDLVEQGRPMEAIHLIDIALSVEPENAVVREARRDALNALLAQTGGRNLWERMWIASELQELSQQEIL